MGYIYKSYVYKAKRKQNFFTYFFYLLIFFFFFYLIFFFFFDIAKIDLDLPQYHHLKILKNRYFFVYNNGLVNLIPDYNDIVIYSDSSFSFKKYYFERIVNRISFGLLIKNFEEKYHFNIYQIVARDGDVVAIKKGKLYVNNKFIKKIELPLYYGNVNFKLFENEIFCVSINNNNYFDSIVIGTFSIKNVVGKIIY